ncbi:MAG TPA: hypothetical protein VGB90_02805, partial [Alphaproteobacteria bacterium]
MIDEFWVVKDTALAIPSEIFRDSFGDGVVPPSGPDGAATYGVFGPGGMTSEAGGKLTMTPSLGEPTVVTTTFADTSTQVTRILSANPAVDPANFLGVGASFEIHGLYDMSSLPEVVGQSFGIRAIDRSSVPANEGDNTISFSVANSSMTGEVIVLLQLVDFA